jgi:hypothetical protein
MSYGPVGAGDLERLVESFGTLDHIARRHGGASMLDSIVKLMDRLPPIYAEKNANLACVLGLLFGGIGLGIYFRSVVDFVLPIGIALAMTVVAGDLGWVAGAIVASLYGYFRAVSSNARIPSTAG